MVTDRVFSFQNIHNFRCFGGYKTASGKQVCETLYRSAQFSRASEADLNALSKLDIKLVADLRRPSERQAEPSHWPKTNGVHVIESDFGGPAEAPHLKFLREETLTFSSIRAFMIETYRRLPFDEGNQFVFRNAIVSLAHTQPDEGFIVHCAAGKDRTGIFCALVLAELGVSDQTILDDYLMTNHAVDFDAIATAMRARLKQKYGRTFGDAELKAFLGVDAEYLTAAFEKMGDLKSYLRKTLGVDESVLDRLRDRLTV